MRIEWKSTLLIAFCLAGRVAASASDDGNLVEQTESLIRDFDCSALLGVDRALIHVFADDKAREEGLLVWASNSACFECSKQLLFNSSSDSPESFCANVWVPFPWGLYLTTRDSVIIESLPDFKFGLYGIYNLTTTTAVPLDVAILTDPNEHPNWPFQLLIILIVVTVVVSFALPYALKRARGSGPAAQSQGLSDIFAGINSGDVKEPLLGSETGAGAGRGEAVLTTRKKHPRLDCIDTFRGMCLAVMIFVNYGGGHFWYTEHSSWNGLTLADVLFPWFMWIMGCSMALSMKGLFEEPDENMRGHFLSVLRRSLILFGLGLFLGNGYHVTGRRHHWRVPGVLQYFGISYFVVSCVMLLVRKRTAVLLRAVEGVDEDEGEEQGQQEQCSWAVALSFPLGPYISCYRWEIAAQLSLFFSYICICLYAPSFPGCPDGYNGPGGRSENGAWASCTGGIHRWVDEKVFGFERLYHSPTCIDLYDCQPYDPEGLLGSMGATFLTFLGLMTGRVLLHHKAPNQRVLRWCFWGLVLVLVAGILCDFAQEGGVIPVNKNLWSASFVLLLAGLGMLCLSVTYLLVDVYKLWTGAPFRWLGLNSILIYCAHGVFDSYFPFAWYQIPSQESHASLLLMNVVGVLCWIAVSFYCYRIKFFVKV